MNKKLFSSCFFMYKSFVKQSKVLTDEIRGLSNIYLQFKNNRTFFSSKVLKISKMRLGHASCSYQFFTLEQL